MITIVEKFLTELERVGRWGVKAITRTASAVKYKIILYLGMTESEKLMPIVSTWTVNANMKR